MQITGSCLPHRRPVPRLRGVERYSSFPAIYNCVVDESRKAGLAFWAQRVLEEAEKVSQNFDPDPVHDLRVALRRCRSMADGFRVTDPDRGWKQLKRLGKELFSRLGELRDVQVMRDWVAKLGGPDDPVSKILLESFDEQEVQLKQNAQVALAAFDLRAWETITRRLAGRTRKVRLEGLVFQQIAAERWNDARQLHRQALRNRSQVSFHRLRIGLKKFRYTVENFLPERHAKWGADLRELQDALGEIHDLDVLSAIVRKQTGVNALDQERWKIKIQEARLLRVATYRAKMVGLHSLWIVWRTALPSGTALQQAGLVRLRTWASFLDHDFEHSKLVTQLALQLYDGLVSEQILRAREPDRRLLEAACLLHDVGRSRAKRGHHKDSYRLICKLAVPLNWTAEELQTVAAIARYHRGSLPHPTQKALRPLHSFRRASVLQLAGILRLAHTFDRSHDKQVRRVHVANKDGALTLLGDGYTESGNTPERLAAARYLLERTCGIAVLVRPSAQVDRHRVAR